MAATAVLTNGNTRYDRRLAEILAHATEVFCDKGYDAASIRDISRASGTSLAGLYYYFRSKEQLLYLIQRDAFETLLSRLEKPVIEMVGKATEATPVPVSEAASVIWKVPVAFGA